MEPPNLEAPGHETTDEEEEGDKVQRVGLEQLEDEQKMAAGAGIGDATTMILRLVEMNISVASQTLKVLDSSCGHGRIGRAHV